MGIVLLVFTQCMGQEQAYYIEGYVKDVNGEPIAKAQVHIPGKRSGITAYTDSDGFYRIKLPGNLKKVRIGITIIGYTPMTNCIGSSCVQDTVFTKDDWKVSKGILKMPDALFRLTGFPGAALIRGRILDAETGEPIAGAKAPMCITNRLGYYYFPIGFAFGENYELKLKFNKGGFNPLSYDTTILIKKGAIINLNNLKMNKIRN